MDFIKTLATHYGVSENIIKECVLLTKKKLDDRVTEAEIYECVMSQIGVSTQVKSTIRNPPAAYHQSHLPLDVTGTIFSKMEPKDFVRVCEMNVLHATECKKAQYWINYLFDKRNIEDYVVILMYIYNNQRQILSDPKFSEFINTKFGTVKRYVKLLRAIYVRNPALYDILYKHFLDKFEQHLRDIHFNPKRSNEQKDDLNAFHGLSNILTDYIHSYNMNVDGYYINLPGSKFSNEYKRLMKSFDIFDDNFENMEYTFKHDFLSTIPFTFDMLKDVHKFFTPQDRRANGEWIDELIIETIANNIKDIKHADKLLKLYDKQVDDFMDELDTRSLLIDDAIALENIELLRGALKYSKAKKWQSVLAKKIIKSKLLH